ncbi:MAG: hypothetical protein K8H88_17615 [Sandaracinaceae bacterium]|nr:hypothetical protein [Sandaracinaceae bacterium]
MRDLNTRLPPCESSTSPNDPATLHPGVGNAWATADATRAARELLVAVASGHVDAAALERLAAAVLSTPAVQLALAVRDGGPLAVRHAIELAALVLAEHVDLGQASM